MTRGNRGFLRCRAALRGTGGIRVLLPATFVALLVGGLLAAPPPKPPKPATDPLHAHRRFVIGQLFRGLRVQLEIAEGMGADPYMRTPAQETLMMLDATVATDSYAADERAHLEKARREVADYLAETDRSPASFKPRLAHIQKALDALALVRKALAKAEGGKP